MYSIKRPSKLAALAIAVSFALVSTSAVSANAAPPSDKTFGDFTYRDLFPGAVSITGCKSDPCPANLRIPEKVFGKKVVEIASFAFVNKGVQTTTLPRWLHDIGSNAFAGNNLQTVTIPASVVGIHEGAFQSNSLTSVTFPRNSALFGIGRFAFTYNFLQNVVLPKNLYFLSDDSFSHNELTSVTFLGSRPVNDENMQPNAFDSNLELTEIGYAAEQDSWSGFETFSGVPTIERIISVPTIMWPTILKAETVVPGSGEVLLTVKAPANELIYRWRVSVDNGATWSVPAGVNYGNPNSVLLVSGLTPGKRYKINVVMITADRDASRKSIAVYVTPPVVR